MQQLLSCPFCGAQVKLTSRPDNIAKTEFVGIVSCFCDGYSANAHQMAIAPTQEEANAAVIRKWNTRQPGEGALTAMTAAEISLLWKRHTSVDGPHFTPDEDDGLSFARAIEAHHGITSTPTGDSNG